MPVKRKNRFEVAAASIATGKTKKQKTQPALEKEEEYHFDNQEDRLDLEDEGDIDNQEDDFVDEREDYDHDNGIDEEEMDYGDEEGNEEDEEFAGPSKKNSHETSKRKEKKMAHLYRTPNSDEISMLKETEMMYRSNFTRLLVTEVIESAQVKYSKLSKLESCLHFLRTSLIEMKPIKDKTFQETMQFFKSKKIHPPFEHNSDFDQHKFKFCPPNEQSISLIGSFLLKTVCKPNLNADIALEIPSECFDKKDYLNYRYFHKKAFYLSYVALHLKKLPQFANIQFSYLNNSLLHPILAIHPSNANEEHDFSKSKFVIRLLPVISNNLFPLSRFLPNKNNVRPKDRQHQHQNDDDGNQYPPTSRYNTAILMDMFHRQHLHMLHSAVKECPGLSDAILLCKVWLRQRNMSQSVGSLDGFLLSMFLVYMHKHHKIASRMSCYQIFRALMKSLATMDIRSQPISFITVTESTLKDFQKAFDLVFLDPSEHLNLFSGISSSAWDEIQNHAKVSFALLDSDQEETFDDLFTETVEPTLKFDNILRWTASPNKEFLESKFPNEKLDSYDWSAFLTNWVSSLLTRALKHRVLNVRCFSSDLGTWDLGSPNPHEKHIMIGIHINPDQAEGLVHLGPPADDLENAKLFRELWGPKAELRRFKDGSIMEATVWEKLPSDRHLIIRDMVLYLLDYHLKANSKENVVYLAGQLDSTLTIPSVEKKNENDYQNKFVLLNSTFDKLVRTLKDLKDLPLDINNIQGVSSALRGTSVFIPSPKDYNDAICPQNWTKSGFHWLDPLEVILTFEKSGHWPDNIEAIEKSKTSFYIRFAQLLKSDASIRCRVSEYYLDIYFEGFFFRMRIYHDRELQLLERDSNYFSTFQLLQRELFLKPQLAGHLHAVSKKFPSFRAATRLVKRWLHEHMFSGDLTEEAIELTVANVYLHPEPFQIPASGLTAFVRWLRLISTKNWQREYVLVNFDNELNTDALKNISESFHRYRKQYSTQCPLFIVYPGDVSESVWTQANPNAASLLRLQGFGKRAIEIFQSRCFEKSFNLKSLFLTPLKNFDAIIHLNEKACPRTEFSLDLQTQGKKPSQSRKNQSTSSIFRNIQLEKISYLPPLVGFDPVILFVYELRKQFSNIGSFHYNELGGRYIAVSWKSYIQDSQNLTVSHSYCTKVTETKDEKLEVSFSLEQTVAEIYKLGQGIVDKIEILKK